VLLLVAIFAAAVGLMISFGVTSQMLKQIHDGRDPSWGDALLSRDMRRMIPRVLGLSAIWYGIVLVVVIIEMIIRAILDRISENLGDAAVNAVLDPRPIDCGAGDARWRCGRLGPVHGDTGGLGSLPA
jgi:hypothetical protein